MKTPLTLPQLASFLKLAELLSFRDAALALGVSQPALSRTIQLIEGRIGARLFDRDTRKVTLTPAGEKLLPMADRLVRNYDSMFKEFDAFVSGQNGHIRIAALPSVAAALLPATIARIRKGSPDVRVDIWEDVTFPVHRAVSMGDAEVGLATPPQTTGELNYKPLLQDELVLVCKTDDPLTRDTEHDWSVFLERPFIGMSSESALRSMMDNAFLQSGLTVKPLFNCKQLSTIGSLIAGSLGISALPWLTLPQLGSSPLTWRALRGPTISRSIGIITLAGHSLSPATNRFVRELEFQGHRLSAEPKTPPI